MSVPVKPSISLHRLPHLFARIERMKRLSLQERDQLARKYHLYIPMELVYEARAWAKVQSLAQYFEGIGVLVRTESVGTRARQGGGVHNL